jgi:protoporphyrinogen oxidase
MQVGMKQKTAIIIGGGPAGLTAAYELLLHTDIKPIIYEQSEMLGGISQTVNYKGNRMDIGGHRFFSKSDRVMQWWYHILPPQEKEEDTTKEKIMLIRNRLSRIYYLRSFFNYPISLNATTIRNLGLWRMTKIGFSYIFIRLFPIRKEKSLEDFLINRFGKELYHTFFKDYTEKVWGESCDRIKPEWGAQRIKGLSISTVLWNAVKKIFVKDKDIAQKNTETSLIEKFLYPKYGPGQMWEEVARIIQKKGGEIHFNKKAVAFENNHKRFDSITILDVKTGQKEKVTAHYYFSSMPVKDLIAGMQNSVAENVRKVANGLMYRDFITVGLLIDKLKVKGANGRLIDDNWIYIQERDVKVGRLQIFNNWSPYLIQDKSKVWLGMEYFCNEGDELWNMQDDEFKKFAIQELAKIEFVEIQDVIDGIVIRMPKTYPAYFGSYDQFDVVKDYLNTIENLFPIGRNGMHRYNNQDHSMLTAMIAVENIKNAITEKENIWNINTEQEYHEEKEENSISQK